MMPTTTLAEIRKHEPCEDGWRKLLKNLGGIKTYGENTPVTLIQILDSNGLNDAIWCLRACHDSDEFSHKFARWCASQVLYLWDAPQVVRDYLATGEESLRASAWAAAVSASRTAWAAAGAASRAAANDVTGAVQAAALAAADAAWAWAWAASRAAAGDAAEDARLEAWDAARAAQADHLRQMCLATMEQAA